MGDVLGVEIKGFQLHAANLAWVEFSCSATVLESKCGALTKSSTLDFPHAVGPSFISESAVSVGFWAAFWKDKVVFRIWKSIPPGVDIGRGDVHLRR